MNPGCELDALVAEKVMGWKRMSWKDYKAAVGGWRADEQRETPTYSWHDVDGDMTQNAEDVDDYYNPTSVWSPSTDIAAAWEVVEKMRGRGLTVEVFFGWESGKDFRKDDWVAEFDDVADEYIGVAKTAPHAICLAALKVVEVAT